MKLVIDQVVGKNSRILGALPQFWSKFIFPLLMFTKLQYGISNSKANFEYLASDYRRNAELTIFCYVNKAQAMLLFAI